MVNTGRYRGGGIELSGTGIDSLLISIYFRDRVEVGAAAGAGPEAGPGPSPEPVASRAANVTMARKTAYKTLCFFDGF